MSTASDSVEASVYRYFDENGRLLYVGITGRGVRRQHEHARSKEWWPLVATSDVQHFPTREQALCEEAYQIRWNQPPFNVQGRTGSALPLRIPAAIVRSMLGRLSRQNSLEEVDIAFVVGEHKSYGPLVRHEIKLVKAVGGSVGDLRNRLKSLAEH